MGFYPFRGPDASLYARHSIATDMNESGIDIVASPPGKRLQNVLLLSGGEKALTALSLLMVIFRYTPSPFRILEAGAPRTLSEQEAGCRSW